MLRSLILARGSTAPVRRDVLASRLHPFHKINVKKWNINHAARSFFPTVDWTVRWRGNSRSSSAIRSRSRATITIPIPSPAASLPTPSILSGQRTQPAKLFGGSWYRRLLGPRSSSRCFSPSVPRAPKYHPNEAYRRFGQPPGWNGRPLWWVVYRKYLIAGAGAVGLFYWYNLETVEMTGRRRFNCMSVEQELAFGIHNYRDTLQQYRNRILPENHPHAVMVDRVMQRLIPLAPIKGADWKVHVIHDDRMMNAFVLPGGKVFVFTGILPVCRDDDGLAAVLGHEIAHVVARHPAERMSNSFIAFGVVILVSSLLDVSGHITSFFMNLLYSLPNSRTQEAEADNIGLMMMSKACFNPEAAMKLWGRMHELQKDAPPQFISTHPSNYNRMEAIRDWLPKAEQAYEESGCSFTVRQLPGFRAVSDWITNY